MAKKNEIAKAGPDALERIDSLSLDQLARHANAEAREAENKALFHACRAGVLLLEAKSRVEHGKWLPWLAQNWHYSQQHANRFMQLAEACKRKPERVKNLEANSIRGALAALGKPVEGAGDKRKPSQDKNPNYSRVSNLPAPPVTDAEFTVRGAPRLPMCTNCPHAAEEHTGARFDEYPEACDAEGCHCSGYEPPEGFEIPNKAPAAPDLPRGPNGRYLCVKCGGPDGAGQPPVCTPCFYKPPSAAELDALEEAERADFPIDEPAPPQLPGPAPTPAPALASAPAPVAPPSVPLSLLPAESLLSTAPNAIAHLEACLAARSHGQAELEDWANLRAAQGLALLTEAGIYHQQVKTVGGRWDLDRDTESTVLRLAKRFVKGERDHLRHPIVGRAPITHPRSEATAELVRRPTRTDLIREVALDERHPILRPVVRARHDASPEQVALLFVRDVWSRVDELVLALKAAHRTPPSRLKALEVVRDAIEPAIAAAERLVRERHGADEPDPKPVKPKKDAKKEGART